MEKEENEKMKALARYGKEFGGYRMIDVPKPTCGPEDIIIEIKAAAICGADMKHYKVDNGSDEFNSIRGHEFAGEIVEVGEKVTDWKVGQRVVSDNSAHVCGVCPACEQGDFLCCESKVNLGLDNNTWGGGFSKYCKVPGEILRIHKHAIWEIPENVKYEEAAVLDPICNSYKAIAQQSHLLPGQDVVVFGTGPLGLFAVQVARIMGAVNIVMVGLDEDVPVRFPVAKELGATHCVNGSKEDVVKRCTEICGRDNLGLVVECSGANIALKQAIEMLRPNGEVVRVGMGFKPLEFSINDITSWNKSIIGHVDYFFPNFEEASEMTGETDEAKVADKLYACGVKNVIMKIGKRGCYIRNADGAMIVPACKGVTAIDTIGAGDNFASGFITGLLEGKDIRECAIYANCTAAVSVQYVGATGGVTDKAIVDKMLAKYREDYK